MTADQLADHLRRPHMRPFQPLALSKDGQTYVGLRDPLSLAGQMMVISPQALPLLQQFQGTKTIDEIAADFKIPQSTQLVELARKLDEFGLLWGPTFERLEGELKTRLLQRGAFPVGATQMLGSSSDECLAALRGWVDQTDDPELDATPVGIVSPHLDYARGWPNYAAAYRCLDAVEQPDRVVVLATNHFGLGDGVVMTELGFETPLGTCASDRAVVEAMHKRLGRSLLVDQLDHHAEHSVQLQLPWLQHRFGNVPVVAALVPDPLQPMVADDGGRVTLEAFVDAMRDTLSEIGGRTFYVSSADLSHVGPQFGEPRPVDDQRRIDVERHDRDMMGKFMSGPTEFLEAMRWCKNPTRWCSVGNMYATLLLSGAEQIELIDYRQACDDQGACLVSSAAMALI
ncbi:MAG: AmmeMemoRadiSam system protein B [Phycisphaerales bacterium]|nr:AmmeMemoRadiSam system protein B [Phycisphaerales bacterium]